MNINYRHNTITETELKDFLISNLSQFHPSFATMCIESKYWQKLYYNATTFEIWNGSNLIGLICAYLNNESKEVYIPYVCISKGYTGKGLASELINIIFTHCKESNFRKISLEVRKNNIPAITLYTKKAFHIVKVENEKIRLERLFTI